MFVGYSLDHPADTYHFINFITKRIIRSRDVKWLDKTWGQYYKVLLPTKDEVQEEIEIYEENENQEVIPEEQEMQE